MADMEDNFTEHTEEHTGTENGTEHEEPPGEDNISEDTDDRPVVELFVKVKKKLLLKSNLIC